MDASPCWCECGKEHEVRLVTDKQRDRTHQRTSYFLKSSEGTDRVEVIVDSWFIVIALHHRVEDTWCS